MSKSFSPFFKQPPKIQWVFPYNDQEVLATWRKQGISPPRESPEPDVLGERWLAYALHHAITKFPEADTRDQYSFAALVQSFYAGWCGAFGTETYEKEHKTEAQAVFLLNRLTEISVSDEAKAKILLIFLEDKYFR